MNGQDSHGSHGDECRPPCHTRSMERDRPIHPCPLLHPVLESPCNPSPSRLHLTRRKDLHPLLYVPSITLGFSGSLHPNVPIPVISSSPFSNSSSPCDHTEGGRLITLSHGGGISPPSSLCMSYPLGFSSSLHPNVPIPVFISSSPSINSSSPCDHIEGGRLITLLHGGGISSPSSLCMSYPSITLGFSGSLHPNVPIPVISSCFITKLIKERKFERWGEVLILYALILM